MSPGGRPLGGVGAMPGRSEVKNRYFPSGLNAGAKSANVELIAPRFLAGDHVPAVLRLAYRSAPPSPPSRSLTNTSSMPSGEIAGLLSLAGVDTPSSGAAAGYASPLRGAR